jgi:hypothetical protein
MGDCLFVPTVGRCTNWSQFESVEGTFTSQWFALIGGTWPVLAEWVGLANGYGQERVEAELIVIVEVFVAQAQAEHSLFEQVEQGVFDAFGVAVIGEAQSEPFEESEAGIHLSQK